MQEEVIDVRESIDIREPNMAQLLMDQYNLKILSSTTRKALSVRDMAFMYFIPLATCYRKVRELGRNVAVVVSGSNVEIALLLRVAQDHSGKEFT